MPAGFSRPSEAMVLHESADGGVTRQHAELRFLPSNGRQIVVHELVAPARVLSTQRPDLSLDYGRDTGVRSCVSWHFASQRFEGLFLIARDIEPALDGFRAEANGLSRCRMGP